MKLEFDYWACPRPMTGYWGSGQVYDRICKKLGKPDIVFGKTDNIPDDVKFIDLNNGYNWNDLPFDDNDFNFGYWDPPYPPAVDSLMKKEALEIWRCCKSLAILHTYVYPISWFIGAYRKAMIPVTFGPLKVVRILQVFEKKNKTIINEK